MFTFLLIVLAAVGLNVFAIVDVARRSDRSFKAVGADKTLWLLLVLLAGFPAAIAYIAAIRPKLEAAPTQLALPGWYPDPSAPGYLRYHDGESWTAAVTPMLPPAQPYYAPQQPYPQQSYPPQQPYYAPQQPYPQQQGPAAYPHHAAQADTSYPPDAVDPSAQPPAPAHHAGGHGTSPPPPYPPSYRS